MKLIAFATLLFFSVSISAQSNRKPGFIVRNTGDTTNGFIEEIETKKLNNSISFAPGNTDQSTVFTTADIKSFGYDGGNSFQKVNYTNPFDLSQNERFVKALSVGYYSLFTFWNKDVKYFIIRTPADTCRFLSDDDVSSNGNLNQKGNFRNELLFISQNCNQLKPELERINYNESDIIKYIEKLNKCVAPESSNNIVYKKEKSTTNIYAYAGGIPLGKNYEYAGRVMAKITVPAVDKNISLNFGVNYIMQHKNSTERFGTYPYKKEQNLERTIISIPLTVQYYFTKGFIKPYVDAGLSFDHLTIKGALKDAWGHTTTKKNFGLGFIGAVGIDGFLTKNIFIKAEYRYELFLHFPTVGIAYTFK